MMKLKQSTLFIICSWAMLFLTIIGCSVLNKNYPQRNYYILNVSNKDQNLSPVSGTVLEIRRFQISPAFAGTGFVYRKGDFNYESDFYNQFFRLPSLLITEEVRNWLSESGLFKYVVDSTNGVEADYILEGNINQLYGDFRAPNTPKAALGIQFVLIEEVSANPKIVFQNNYRREMALSSNSPEDLVKGWNEALQQILTALEKDLRAANFKAAQ